MGKFNSLACFLISITLSFNCFAQSTEQIEIPFTSQNGFSGKAYVEFSYALENFYKLRVNLKKIHITSLKTSLGEFSKDELLSEGITFPFECSNCSLRMEGATTMDFSADGNTIPFELDTSIQPDHMVTVKMKYAVPEEEDSYQQAKKNWEENTSISKIEVLTVKGTEMDKSITAVKRYSQKAIDREKLDYLVTELSGVPDNEWKGKIYANRSSFYNKQIPDSLLQAVSEGRFKPKKPQASKPSYAMEMTLGASKEELKTTKAQEKTTSYTNPECAEQIATLEARKKKALTDEDYLAAASFKALIKDLAENCGAFEIQTPIMDAPVAVTELNIPVQERDDEELEETITSNALEKSTKDEETDTQEETSSLGNLMGSDANSVSLIELTKEQTNSSEQHQETLAEIDSAKPKKKSKKAKKLGKLNFDFSSDIKKYKRSSLHSMMIQNPGAEQADVIEQTFLDRPLPEKFNTHHISKNFISVLRKARKQDKVITEYLNRNAVARELVAKWFNRNERGEFNMDLIAERGHYNATVFDVNIAKKSERGLAMLADAGEQLIGNTFVIVTDYKYTNKEEVAKKTSFLSSLVSAAATAAGAGDVALVADAVTLGTTVAGKGYIVKATSYLYRLVWNERIANTFYNEMWIDQNTFDSSKKRAFDTTNLFELALVGYETDWSDVQSSAFTNKSDAELIQRATIKATDQTIAKLQRKYEIFRTKTPLISTEPLAAKIGLKEGLEKGDKFEVLEQFLRKDGTIGYQKVGVIKVDKYNIWDNRYAASEENSSSLNYTVFSGGKNKYYQGMLIRQIN